MTCDPRVVYFVLSLIVVWMCAIVFWLRHLQERMNDAGDSIDKIIVTIKDYLTKKKQ